MDDKSVYISSLSSPQRKRSLLAKWLMFLILLIPLTVIVFILALIYEHNTQTCASGIHILCFGKVAETSLTLLFEIYPPILLISLMALLIKRLFKISQVNLKSYILKIPAG